MKIWLDDIRTCPIGYTHCRSVNEAIQLMINNGVEEIDLDHDLGEYAHDGGDGIKLIDWCIENNMFPKVKLHTANPVGRANMQRTIDRYWNK